MTDLPTVTVTLFATDIVNSTALWERHHAVMSAALARHDAILRHAVESLGGHIFKMVGDGCYAAFADATDAVAAALAAQRLLVAEPWDLPEPLRVRMALHSGMVERRAGDYFGSALNCIAHLVAVAHGGQILLSLVTAALLRDHLPSDVLLHDVGWHQLKGLAQRERVFQLVAPELPGDFPPLNTRDGMMYNIPAQPTGRTARVARPTTSSWRCRTA